MNEITRSLATLGHARQHAAQAAADGIGNRTDKILNAAWRQLLAVMRQQSQPGMAALAVQRALRPLLPELQTTLATGLEQLAETTHERAARGLVKTLPAEYLRAALRYPAHHRPRHIHESALLEGGLLQVALDAAGLTAFGMPDPPEDETAARNLIQSLLFPPPDRSFVYRLIRGIQISGQTWEQRLYGEISARFSPAIIAGIISRGYSDGLNQRQIAQQLLPAMDGIRNSARRVARTYGMAIAHEMNMRTSAGLGDLVIGYTVHSVHGNPYSRPWHVERDGTHYFKEPKEGQRGYPQMPHPPFEADDPRERPAGTPHMAWNCLCYLTPILRPLQESRP